MLNKKELIKSLKKFSNFTVVSLTSLVLVGGSLSNTASAKQVRHVHYSRKVNKNNYQALVDYLNWVYHYDYNHMNNWYSYKLSHLYEYMNGLNDKQYHNIEALFNKDYESYYCYYKSMKNVSKYFKNINMNASRTAYKHLTHMFYIDSRNNDSKNNNALNSYIANNWYNLTDNQLEKLSHSYNINKFLNTGYNLHEYNNFKKRYNEKVRFTATNNVNELAQQDNEFDTEVRADLIEDINNTRKHYGRRPLIITNAMQATADYRNPKVMYAYEHYNNYKLYPHNTSNPSDNWVHGTDTHTSGADYLNNNHYDWHSWSTNAGGTFKGNRCVNGDGTPLRYNNNIPEGFAGNINDGLMNHDNCEGNHNGHRHNELGKNWKYLGVGVIYDSAAHMGSFNEQFAC